MTNKEFLGVTKHIMSMSNLDEKEYSEKVNIMKENSRIALHFHPDRTVNGNSTVIESLFESGIYKNQYESKISNGGLTANTGRDRDIWENDLFGNTYDENTSPEDRPKYGAWDLGLFVNGPAPRFGSCYFLLNRNVMKKRATFTYLDSSIVDQNGKGTINSFDCVLNELIKDLFILEFALGKKFNVRDFFDIYKKTNLEINDFSKRENGNNLNSYIESQIHGVINLKNDVEYLVCDSSFKGTQIEKNFKKITKKYDIELFWYPALCLPSESIPSDFRGPLMPQIAKKISKNGIINAKTIGDADRLYNTGKLAFKDLEFNYCDPIQALKYLWHLLVRHGTPLHYL